MGAAALGGIACRVAGVAAVRHPARREQLPELVGGVAPRKVVNGSGAGGGEWLDRIRETSGGRAPRANQHLRPRNQLHHRAVG